MADKPNERKITLVLQSSALEQLDTLRKQWGMRSRGPAIERLLEYLLNEIDADIDNNSNDKSDELDSHQIQGALVLVTATGESSHDENWLNENEAQPPSAIDLPGFVSKRSQKLNRSLRAPRIERNTNECLITIDANYLLDSISSVQNHWMSLYGSEPNQAVLEASMYWLSHDIWPLADASEGNPFTWNALQQVMLNYAPSWEIREPSVDRVIIAAGILEDPFGASALQVRIPSLVGRMTQRLRRKRRGTPFLDLQATMTTQGALQLLKLPTTVGCSLTLQDIREAYRQQAIAAHPDAGGNPEDMRRLNEAYQLLKQRYLKPF